MSRVLGRNIFLILPGYEGPRPSVFPRKSSQGFQPFANFLHQPYKPLLWGGRSMTDAELIEGCSKGSRNHQRALYERYSALMMGVCMRYAANEEEAEDILQDGFVTVFGKINTFAGRGELGAWMRKVFLNTALMAYRKNKARLLQTDVDTLSYSLDSGEDLFSKVAAQDLMYMIQQLPSGARVIFNLYAVEGHEHHEIAEQLGISVGTSKSQYSRARQLLREMIELEAQRVHGSTIRK